MQNCNPRRRTWLRHSKACESRRCRGEARYKVLERTRRGPSPDDGDAPRVPAKEAWVYCDTGTLRNALVAKLHFGIPTLIKVANVGADGGGAVRFPGPSPEQVDARQLAAFFTKDVTIASYV